MYLSGSHLSEILKPSVDIDSLKDPEEFFKAHERLESKLPFVSLFICLVDGILNLLLIGPIINA